MEPVAIVSTGTANTASVLAAFQRAGCTAELTRNASRVRTAERVVLPGVGTFGVGMAQITASGLDDAIRCRVDREQPLLAICLGMQLLCARSEESPGTPGIGVLDVPVRRLPDHVTVPQFGWNTVEANGNKLISTGNAYYANSYCLTDVPDGWVAATTTHGSSFIAALERGPILACQFHPELSGSWGAGLIERWIRCAARTTTC